MINNVKNIYEKHKKNRIWQHCIYFIQALFGFPLIIFLRILPVDISSYLMGKIVRIIGPFTKENKVALLNLSLVFPDKSIKDLNNIARDEWENIGRVIGEFPHISRKDLFLKRMEIDGAEYATKVLKEGKGGVFVSIHMGNWELCSLVASSLGIKLNTVYRSPNNPFFENIFRFRTLENNGEVIPKGKHSGIRIIQLAKQKGFIGMLIDQKLREGLELKFFGKPAMTTHFPALLAYRFNCPIIMVKTERTKGVNFKVTIYPPIYSGTEEKSEDKIKELSQELNDIIEGWIKENPSQWLWIHKRWNSEVFKDTKSSTHK